MQLDNNLLLILLRGILAETNFYAQNDNILRIGIFIITIYTNVFFCLKLDTQQLLALFLILSCVSLIYSLILQLYLTVKQNYC